MKIGRQASDSSSRRGWYLVLLGVFILGLFLGGRRVPARLQNSLTSLITPSRTQAKPASIPILTLDLPFENYNTLLQLRRQALQTGVYIPANRDFMTATLRLDNSPIPIHMRFYPGPADHLENPKKWNFDIRTQPDHLLLGMQRFYLLNPAEHNWLDQWAFSRSLEREGLLTTQYQFVNLVFNGDNWGIYALLEGFGDQLMTANGRTAGVILEFDADLLWQSIAYFGGEPAAVNDSVANLLASDFRYFEIDPFREATIADDELRSAQKEAGVSRLRQLQAGQLDASQVFDIDQYGRFLALVDLWGANQAVSLVNLRYYYNPSSQLLEPIGFVGHPLADSARLPLAATYHNLQLQTAYAQYAALFSQASYLEALKTELDDQMQSLQAALRPQSGQLQLPWDALAARQVQMRRSLNPIQPIFAHLGPPSLSMSATIQLDVANVINLPIEILGFDVNATTFLEVDPTWLQTIPTEEVLLLKDGKIILPAGENPAIRYVQFHLPLAEIVQLDQEADFIAPIQIRVATQVLGLPDHQLTLAREYSEDRTQP